MAVQRNTQTAPKKRTSNRVSNEALLREIEQLKAMILENNNGKL